MIPFGFRFREALSGTYYRLDEPFVERSISFSYTARADSVPAFLLEKVARMDGIVTVDGLCDKAELEGRLVIKTEGNWRVSYDFWFRGKDQRRYNFHGEKDLFWVGFFGSISTLPGSLYDDAGAEVARASLSFDVRKDLPQFLRSLKVAVGTFEVP
jgi:hypothetical protein